MAVERPLDEDIYSLLQRQYVGGGTPVGAPAAAPMQPAVPPQGSVQQAAATPVAGTSTISSAPADPVFRPPPGVIFEGSPEALAAIYESTTEQSGTQTINPYAGLGTSQNLAAAAPILGFAGEALYDPNRAGFQGSLENYSPAYELTPEYKQFLDERGYKFGTWSKPGVNGQYFGVFDQTGALVPGTEQFQSNQDVAVDIVFNALAVLATGGAINAVLTAAVPGISTATAGALSRALAPTVVQAASTGRVDLNSAVRNVVGSFVGQSLGSQAANAANQAYLQATGTALPPAALQAVSNAAASAAATSMQQGADLSDVGRNALAGSVSAAVGDTLRQQGIDPNIAAGTGRAVGSYVSSGSGVQAIVSGLTRGLTYEEPQQRPAPVEERVGTPVPPERETAPPAPPPAPEPVAEAPAPAEPTGPQTIEVTGQRPTGPTPDFISTPTAGEPRAPAPPPPRQQQGVTVSPTDVFSLIKRSGQGPQSLSRITSMAYPMGRTMGTGAFSPAGEVDAGGSYQARQPVWNEASLRLKDALGL